LSVSEHVHQQQFQLQMAHPDSFASWRTQSYQGDPSIKSLETDRDIAVRGKEEATRQGEKYRAVRADKSTPLCAVKE